MKHDIESALDTVDRTIVRYKRGYIYSSVHVRDHMTAELENKQQSKNAIRLSCNARSTKTETPPKSGTNCMDTLQTRMDCVLLQHSPVPFLLSKQEHAV